MLGKNRVNVKLAKASFLAELSEELFGINGWRFQVQRTVRIMMLDILRIKVQRFCDEYDARCDHDENL